jgi:hypothetical protein
MDTRFLRPKVIWSGVWIAIFMLLCSIGYWQSKLYGKSSFERVQQREFNMLHSYLPYSLAFLEEHGQTEAIRELLKLDRELFTLVYTDPAGAIKYPDPSGAPRLDSLGNLDKYKFTYVNMMPGGQPKSAASDAAGENPAAALNPRNGAGVYGKLYLIAKKQPSWQEGLGEKNYFQNIWPGESFLGFTIIGYLLLLVGLAAICSITARFQSHFQGALEEQHRSELETRDLRIQVLESNLRTLDLRLQLLNQRHEEAVDTSNKAQRAMDRLAKKLQSESTKNEELEAKLGKAQIEHDQALEAIRGIKADIARVAAEKQELETMRQAEQQEFPARSRHYSAKEYLWLNLVYKNLAFSKRALQNIGEIQYAHDVFPSLPDALAVLNNSSVEALVSGEGIPSRSVVRYTQPLENFKGCFWEYRFSRDGRIFFGLSQSRTLSVDTILLKRHYPQNRYKYEKYLENTLGKDNNDLKPDFS